MFERLKELWAELEENGMDNRRWKELNSEEKINRLRCITAETTLLVSVLIVGEVVLTLIILSKMGGSVR
jgi:hypothetical protein